MNEAFSKRIQSALRIKHVAQYLGLLDFVNWIAYLRSNPINAATQNFYGRWISEDSLCFDIGAHYGRKTELFASLGARVVAVEPLPKCQRALGRLARGNIKIKVVAEACGAESGIGSFFICDLAPQLSTLSIDFKDRGPYADKFAWRKKQVVRLTTLDSLVQEYGLPAFLKIDCEGYEDRVFLGLSQPIQTVFFEFSRPNLPVLESCLRSLKSLGKYDFHFFDDHALKLWPDHPLTDLEILASIKNDENLLIGEIACELKPAP